VESCKSKKVPRIATAAGKYRHLDTNGWKAPLAWFEFADWSDARIIERGRIPEWKALDPSTHIF
jgi:hypothetical protein